MDEKILRALVNAGAVKRMHIITNGGLFYIEADTPNGHITALTLMSAVKDAAHSMLLPSGSLGRKVWGLIVLMTAK